MTTIVKKPLCLLLNELNLIAGFPSGRKTLITLSTFATTVGSEKPTDSIVGGGGERPEHVEL